MSRRNARDDAQPLPRDLPDRRDFRPLRRLCPDERGDRGLARGVRSRPGRIWAELPGRRAKLGIGLHRLGWTQDDIRSFILGTLRAGGGTWVFGVYGAVAEFCIGPGKVVDLDLGDVRSSRRRRGGIRFELSEQVRALALATADGSTRTEVIVLAVPRARSGGRDIPA